MIRRAAPKGFSHFSWFAFYSIHNLSSKLRQAPLLGGCCSWWVSQDTGALCCTWAAPLLTSPQDVCSHLLCFTGSLYSWEFYCYWGGPILASPSTMPQLFYVTPRAFKTNTIWIILPLPIQPPEVGTQPWPPPEHSFCMLTEQTLPRRLYFNTADLFLISINSLAPADHLSQ